MPRAAKAPEPVSAAPPSAPNLFVGTSGWAYPSWKPEFYPAKVASAKFLGYYGTRLNSVELNYTFRHFPTQKLLTGWIGATPSGFRFAVKAHQTITHVQRLRNTSPLCSDFLTALEPLRRYLTPSR